MEEGLEREVLWREEGPQGPSVSERLKSWGTNFAASWKDLLASFGVGSLVDRILVSTGVTAALASAAFAAGMISTDHSHPMFGGIEHLMLFAQPMHSKPKALMARVQKPPIAEPGIDYAATGTIRPKNPPAPDPGDVAPIHLPATEPIIRGYYLQEARAGFAVVQGQAAAYRVLPGAFLPGAGRVLSVEQRNDKWVVVTTQGVIVDRLSAQEAP
jgi:hypothetical protein